MGEIFTREEHVSEDAADGRVVDTADEAVQYGRRGTDSCQLCLSRCCQQTGY